MTEVLAKYVKPNNEYLINIIISTYFLSSQESTYGTHIHEKRDEREARFTGTIHDIVNRGGRCLIPVFALGRAQELLLILGEKFKQIPTFRGLLSPCFFFNIFVRGARDYI